MLITRIIGRTIISFVLIGGALKVFKKIKKNKTIKDENNVHKK